ncbi:cysteine--tRNA ligase [Syntrophobacter fumaroxidans]|uniref:Cysteine--tRNA ligase n=1 Tax=Syntrophobacter fumaroxidans (strain DSM 10017 / MPOB) TaxID=335543 RepID=SYC_SYNFM|nr:cysteine--tRNA ligase [Syntrophobacter fumaroxidans]A0LIR9.1 RecName: Full=Cysteine--tRNA ligase; AltName: Full=Cysteinyl-tRNA synthetase; Short=CysRS [Syntrophobacter fumaroxidans MPOB]ABK17321.1 cysteinyl-tRNA synthetase [Syntrophobacter fumaroxidans MPOB]
MVLHVYNTLTKSKEEFIPLEPGKVKFYVCGVTVYDLSHIGHARSAIVFDVIYRYLRFLGFEVTYVRNFTDVDDKIIRRANDAGTDCRSIAQRYIAAFYEDMDALGVLRPDLEPLATENVPGMIEIIRVLMDKGIAYQAGADVFFEIEKFPGYGKLSGRQIEDMLAGARVEVDARKRNPLDFVLWKGSKPGEPSWDSPWGPGRPGWHIECSAMGSRFLGKTFDIHGGGKDLIFPHHENEIAQSEAAFGMPFVRYWLHNGFVNINNEKMSKSLGNFLTIRDVLQKVHPETVRFFVLSKHYRSPVDFSDETIGEAEKGLERLYGTLGAVKERAAAGVEEAFQEKALRGQDPELFDQIAALSGAFREAMDNDFNTAQALGNLFSLQRHLQRFLDKFGRKQLKGPASALARAGADAIRDHALVLGLLTREPEAFQAEQRSLKIKSTGLTEAEVERCIELRRQARQDKNFAEADRLREEIEKKGIQLEDSPAGTRWRVG